MIIEFQFLTSSNFGKFKLNLTAKPNFHTFVLLKWFSIILSVYIVLSGLSCTNFDQCYETSASTELTAGSNSEQHEDNDCAPFCTCLCCTYTAFAYPVFNDVPKVEIIISTQTRSMYKFCCQDNFFAKIWQPPKIS